MLDLVGVLICEFLIVLCLWVYFRYRQKSIYQEIDYLTRKVHFLESSGDRAKRPHDNHQDNRMGRAAELRERFENACSMGIRVPEKYRHVIRLARSGLGVREVAEILDVSKNEAEQMLSLARSFGGKN